MAKQTSQNDDVSRRRLIPLAFMGIIGLILLGFGIFSILEKSILVGLISLVLGVFIYFMFILMERKLKIF